MVVLVTTQENVQENLKIVDWDVKHQFKQKDQAQKLCFAYNSGPAVKYHIHFSFPASSVA